MANRLENNGSHASNPNQPFPGIVEEKPKSIVGQLVNIVSYFWRKSEPASNNNFEFSLIGDDFGFELVDKDDNSIIEEAPKSIVAQLSALAYAFFEKKTGDVPEDNFASILGSEVVGDDEEFTTPLNFRHGPMDDEEIIDY